jgi:hypothetical protein
MAVYRIYCVDGVGKFTHAEWLEADADEEALAAAGSLAHGLACEVWEHARFIGAVQARVELNATKTFPADSCGTPAEQRV